MAVILLILDRLGKHTFGGKNQEFCFEHFMLKMSVCHTSEAIKKAVKTINPNFREVWLQV
jgi:alanine-alpha-ketoisovalerate/valine-pyruvate aminotransferase